MYKTITNTKKKHDKRDITGSSSANGDRKALAAAITSKTSVCIFTALVSSLSRVSGTKKKLNAVFFQLLILVLQK